VNIVFNLIRQIVIDDQFDVFDVDSTGRDIGCHQHTIFAALESLKRGSALSQRAI